MDNSRLGVTVRGILAATALAALFTFACLISSEGDSLLGVVAIYAVRFLTFFAALAAPFEKAWAGLLVGLGFFALWLLGLVVVTAAVGTS
jgi:hypothetical protein